VNGRNRSEGWTHAKLSGHALEDQLADALQRDSNLASGLHEDCFGVPEPRLPRVSGGGIAASHVECVLGGVTPSKADLRVAWPSGRSAGISLKKSEGGQVWLVTPERFFAGFERQFGRRVPDSVRLGLGLFIGPVTEREMRRVLGGRPTHGPVRKKDGVSQEFHQERFVAATLEKIIPREWSETLAWLRCELPSIVELCFARGLCASAQGNAEFIWYHVLGEGSGRRIKSRIVPVAELIRAIRAMPEARRAVVGPRNGGSTITLPFGFLQMHRPAGGNQLQFHHGLEAIQMTLGI
jgi:hypothetical protein